ncbi:MAG: acyltransferase family protein [Methylacidiphilales bacterium]|nr:acyltransferase family protein [Candidatus Methylacidiphilales bacterium]
MYYRREIDGLRAIAIIPVILFHTGNSFFTGGYLGVDIFFVISGYLITSIIYQEMQQSTFSFKSFYMRRVRRILPALYFLLFVLFLIVPFFLFPEDYSRAVFVGFSSIFFLSNVFLANHSGYFDQDAIHNPLVHTWSLSIEEQFYFSFPLILFVTVIFGRRLRIKNIEIWLLVLLFILILLGIYIAQLHSISDPIVNYYRFTSRYWELLAGSFCAICVNHAFLECKNRWWNEIISGISITTIILSIAFFSEESNVPSVKLIIPILASCLLILYTYQNKSFVSMILQSRLLVGIGLLSYSLYLWHQPVFVITHTLFGNWSTLTIIVAFIAISMLSIISYYFVEKPFRNKNTISNKTLLLIISSSTILLIAWSVMVYYTKGLEFIMAEIPFEKDARKSYLIYKENLVDPTPTQDSPCMIAVERPLELPDSALASCFNKWGTAIIIIGDSHGYNLYDIFLKHSTHRFVISFAQGGCRPAQKDSNSKKKCANSEIAKFILDQATQIKNVYYIQAGLDLFTLLTKNQRRLLFNNDDVIHDIQDSKISAVLSYLQLFSHKVPTIWIGPWVDPFIKPHTLSGFKAMQNKNFAISDHIISHYKRLDAKIIDRVTNLREKTVWYLSIIELILPFGIASQQCSYFIDEDHLSPCGTRMLGKAIYNSLDEFSRVVKK